MNVRAALRDVGRRVAHSWRALINRMRPAACVRAELTLHVAHAAGGSTIVSASFERPIVMDPRITPLIVESRDRLRSGRSFLQLVEAARRSNVMIGAHVVSGVEPQHHYFVCIIPVSGVRQVR